MPTLPNARHELFCQEVAKGKSAHEAYGLAGYNPNRRNAHVLSKRSDISGRVSELLAARDKMAAVSTQMAAERLSLDREWVLAKLVENARVALGDAPTKITLLRKGSDEPLTAEVTMRDANAANRALELVGKELGMFIDRSENTNKNFELSSDMPTADEWAAEHVVTGH